MDSLKPVCKYTRFFKYADDLTVLYFMRNSVEDKLQVELENIESYGLKNIVSSPSIFQKVVSWM